VLDKAIFGEAHIYRGPTCKEMYGTGSFEVEGIVGTLTSIFTCFLGVQTGRFLLYHTTPIPRLSRLTIFGVLLSLTGALLCEGKKNGGWIPINKNLWSPSFVLVMAGTGNLAIALCYIFVDVINFWNGAPFIYVGMNSILIYVGHELLGGYFPFSFHTENSYSSHSLLLASSLLGVMSWLFIAYVLFRQKIFINI